MGTFIESASSRETSPEIMAACLQLACNNESDALVIWDDPSESELIAVWKIVTKNGLIPAVQFFWGEFGSDWAADIADTAPRESGAGE